MADEYLWDRTGPPDREVARLEGLLAGYGHHATKSPRRRTAAWLAVAAGVALAVSATLWFTRAEPSEWKISEWKIGGRDVRVGQTIQTDGQSGARLEADEVGRVELDPNSRLRILPSELALQRGTLHAFIWAPPARFVVQTPSARTVDLGCSYTLTVLQDDSGLLTVQTGWVAFQAGAVESFIPAGAACRTGTHRGPGLPYFEDAPAALREAVARFDGSGGRTGLNGIVENARKKDALTLWHLLVRTSGSDRNLVVNRFAELVPGANAAGLREGQSAAIDAAWNLLDLGGTNWWRMWKHNWRTAKPT